MADIFVSYTSSDKQKAFWIGQQLKKLGHTPHLHDWEISAGGDISAWMEERHHQADHILCVISKAYLTAPYSRRERRAAQWAAADERPNFALPVMIEDCELPSMLADLKRCELYGLEEETARTRLREYLAPAAPPPVPVAYARGATVDQTADTSRPHVEAGSYYAVSNIPIAVPRHFLGRDKVLSDIRDALTRGNGRVAITALYGLRGVGKTTLAAAYADKHRADYRATWWIRAQTDSTMRADLVALGVRLGWVAADEKEEAALRTVKEKLRDEGDGILLIFDNANNQDELRSYLPISGATQILVTSNAPNWAGVAAPVQIRVWPKETGADFLLSRVPGRIGERAAAGDLSEALGGLPLAHEQAAAFCERLGLSFGEYLKRFATAPAKLLDAQKDAPAEYHDRTTVAKTFGLAIDEAAKLHPAAAPLIEYAALLAPEPIPLFLFSEGRDKFAEPFAAALAGDGLDEAVAALRAFALIDRESIPDERDPIIVTDCIRLHRLIGEVAAARPTVEGREAAMNALVRAMEATVPIDVYKNPTTWPNLRRLDAVAFPLLAGKEGASTIESEEASFVLDALAAYRHHALAAYAAARPLYERALAIREKVNGPDALATGSALNNLANLLQDQGDLVAARPLFERALAIAEAKGDLGLSVISTRLNNVANLLRAQGDFAAARPLFERALAVSEKVHGSEHPLTTVYLNNLALLMSVQGDFNAARELYERALKMDEKVSGSENLSTATLLGNLADLIWTEKRSAEALPMVRRALAIKDKLLGPEHPSTKFDALRVSRLLTELGRADEARAVREKYEIEG
jgi:tetratricopeptide (TPR) repeat protein